MKTVKFLIWSLIRVHKVTGFLETKNQHRNRRKWVDRVKMNVEEKNEINDPLVPRDKIMFLLISIKLGFMNQFVKALDKENHSFQYIWGVFPALSMEQLKQGIFDGLGNREFIKANNFVISMNITESNAWRSFVAVLIKKSFLLILR